MPYSKAGAIISPPTHVARHVAGNLRMCATVAGTKDPTTTTTAATGVEDPGSGQRGVTVLGRVVGRQANGTGRHHP